MRNTLYSPKGLILGSVLCFLMQSLFIAPQLLKRKDYIAPPLVIKHLSAGLNIQMADSFWLRAIQDFDFCDQPVNEKECHGQSWLFHVINLTVELDPIFKDAYFYGALALTVLISDYTGASQIFDKAVTAYPNDWMINYTAGYHALYEEKNKTKAGRLYLAAADHGAPSWVRLMAGRLAFEGGDKDFAKKVLMQMMSIDERPEWIERLRKKMSSSQE